MPTDYYSRIPRLLREEFTSGRWLPVVGAGISANGVTDDGRHPPRWNALGDTVAAYLPSGYGTAGPIDALSAFEQLHGRPALIDLVHDALLIDQVRPGRVHREFARIPFETVVTTNLDYLLESAWLEVGWPFEPIVGEQRLGARRRRHTTKLIKYHGDTRHPNEAVITEEDFDGFLNRYPILGTYLASLLISRVPVLMGYSLDDPDFRAILQLLSERLGRNRPAPWVILAKGTAAEIAKYERRGVRVVVLDKRPNASHSEVLAEFFAQLAHQLPDSAAVQAEGTEDQVLSEIRLPDASSKILIVFLGDNEFVAQHREVLFPSLEASGLIPATPDQIRNREGLALAGFAQLLRRAAVIVIDFRGSGSYRSRSSLQYALSQGINTPIVVLVDNDTPRGLHGDMSRFRVVVIRESVEVYHEVLNAIYEFVGSPPGDARIAAIEDRLRAGDTAFAFLEAVILLESTLRANSIPSLDSERGPFMKLVRQHPMLESDEDQQLVRDAYALRSEFLHRNRAPSTDRAMDMTVRLLRLLRSLRAG